MKKGLKRSAIVGAIRGFLLLAAISTLEYNGISNDVYSRGASLNLGYGKISSLAWSSESTLFFSQLVILAPLGCILGAVLGIMFDRVAEATRQRHLRTLEKISFPILFFYVFLLLWGQLFLSQPTVAFDKQRWRSVMFIERRAMVDDLTSHHKLKGLTVEQAKELLGPPDKDADPWYRISKRPDSPCLAYDLGHLTFKYGLCLALYYGKDQKIEEWEITRYKFW